MREGRTIEGEQKFSGTGASGINTNSEQEPVPHEAQMRPGQKHCSGKMDMKTVKCRM